MNSEQHGTHCALLPGIPTPYHSRDWGLLSSFCLLPIAFFKPSYHIFTPLMFHPSSYSILGTFSCSHNKSPLEKFEVLIQLSVFYFHLTVTKDDLNIHVDNLSDIPRSKFSHVHDSNNRSWSPATHSHGHPQDLVIIQNRFSSGVFNSNPWPYSLDLMALIKCSSFLILPFLSTSSHMYKDIFLSNTDSLGPSF